MDIYALVAGHHLTTDTLLPKKKKVSHFRSHEPPCVNQDMSQFLPTNLFTHSSYSEALLIRFFTDMTWGCFLLSRGSWVCRWNMGISDGMCGVGF